MEEAERKMVELEVVAGVVPGSLKDTPIMKSSRGTRRERAR